MTERSVVQKLVFDNWIALKYSVFLFLLSTSEDFIHLLQLWSYNTEISDYSDYHVTLIFLSTSVIPVNIVFEGSAVFDAPCQPGAVWFVEVITVNVCRKVTSCLLWVKRNWKGDRVISANNVARVFFQGIKNFFGTENSTEYFHHHIDITYTILLKKKKKSQLF